MNLKSKALLLLIPVIIIPILIIGAVSADKLKLATEARLSTGITTLLDQISRQSFDAAFIAKENKVIISKGDTGTEFLTSNDEAVRLDMALDLFSLKSLVNTHVIGETGYLLVIDNSGEIVFMPKIIPLASAENMLRLLGEKITMEHSEARTEIVVDGKIVFSYWKELASGMNVIAFLPKDDVIKASYGLSKPVITLAIVMALFVIISVLMFLRYLVTKPLDALNAAARDISNGNLDVDINFDRNDEIGKLSKYFYDVSKNLKQSHEEVSYIAKHDSLTGLPNRSLFNDYLENILAIASTKKQAVALLFIVFNNLKQINEIHGQEGGDTLLKEMALRLNKSLRKNNSDANDFHDKSYDIVSRFGGNEFIVLLDNIEGPWDATVVSDRILKLLQKPVEVNNEEACINFSIGATVFPDDSLTAQELIKNADIAMYRAKDRGENHYQFYSDKTDTVMHKHLRIYSRLRNAIDGGQFFMEYQPRLDALSGKMIGMEALIRWQDPDDGLIEPEVFLPIAEDSGLISEITKWVIHYVCRQANEWFLSGRLTVPVAVNISALEFKRFDLLTVITNTLEETELPPELLELELTEASIQSGTDDVVEIMTGLKKLGVGIALNNFGTGYSSLSDLNQLPLNALKIDRSFVAEVKSPGDDSAIINAIISIGHALDLAIVADGVETEIQREYLNSKNCDAMQGSLFSRPLSVDDITSQLDELLVDET